jgi:hypothetical protein
MNIHSAAHYMKSGYRIRRAIWRGKWISEEQPLDEYRQLENLLAEDWEIDFTDMIDDSGIEVLYKESPSDEEE